MRPDRAAARQLFGQLHPLRLAAREGRGGLAELEIAHAGLGHQPQAGFGRGNFAKQRQRLLDGQVEHLADIVARGTFTASTSRLKRRP